MSALFRVFESFTDHLKATQDEKATNLRSQQFSSSINSTSEQIKENELKSNGSHRNLNVDAIEDSDISDDTMSKNDIEALSREELIHRVGELQSHISEMTTADEEVLASMEQILEVEKSFRSQRAQINFSSLGHLVRAQSRKHLLTGLSLFVHADYESFSFF